MARIKRTARPIGDLVDLGSTLGSSAQDTAAKDCCEQLHAFESLVRTTETENCSVEQGDADEVNISVGDFGLPDTGIDESYDENDDVDIEDLGEESVVELASVDLGKVGRFTGFANNP